MGNENPDWSPIECLMYLDSVLASSPLSRERHAHGLHAVAVLREVIRDRERLMDSRGPVVSGEVDGAGPYAV